MMATPENSNFGGDVAVSSRADAVDLAGSDRSDLTGRNSGPDDKSAFRDENRAGHSGARKRGVNRRFYHRSVHAGHLDRPSHAMWPRAAAAGLLRRVTDSRKP
jgi:hypothetical protein